MLESHFNKLKRPVPLGNAWQELFGIQLDDAFER
jgi:hypothetical protein